MSVTPGCFGGVQAALVVAALLLGAATDVATDGVPAVGLGVAPPPPVQATARRPTAVSARIRVQGRI
ncbi:MAG: hypothetical protein M3R57_06310 [Chloroflexota bacterium]|nr:hypothetical protein [Chloroflexota bacterium]